jgi:tripartite-type tricarboxylate transporter receptor subunit TctC
MGIGSYTSLSPNVQSGRLRLIGVTNHVRVPDNPDLPVLAQTVPGYDMRGWFGVVAPAGTPREIVRRLNEEINRAAQRPDVNAKLVAAGLIVANDSPETFAAYLKSEYEKYGKLVRDIGFQPQ